ncbi:MAG TPA: hypothetical protein VI503_06555 [Gaiellaceae bacterium]|nr:hypothetical protein [Gaiellaceae bacterium]
MCEARTARFRVPILATTSSGSQAVAFGTKTRSSGRAPTKAARAARAVKSSPGCSLPSEATREARRVKKSVGPRSSSRWRRWYSSKTGRGQAP